MRARPLAVLGGTFDPVHFGHLRPALELAEALDLARVLFVPCGVPPHRGRPGAAAPDRLEMVRLAVAEEPRFAVDDRELRREGPSYMVDTLQSLRDELGPDRSLILVLGMDAFAGLDRWHRWQRLSELAHLLVMQRPGAGVDPPPALAPLVAARVDPAALATRPAGGVAFTCVTGLDIAATSIRALVAAGRSPRFLLPEPVRAYIQSNGLYRTAAPMAPHDLE